MSLFRHLAGVIIVRSILNYEIVDTNTYSEIKEIMNDRDISFFLRIDFFKNVIIYEQLKNFTYVIFTDIY